jgi:hypothetical protein
MYGTVPQYTITFINQKRAWFLKVYGYWVVTRKNTSALNIHIITIIKFMIVYGCII